ncbi:MAG: hypothetical protein RL194_1318, partial [Pseudomonadota bacterium]
MNRRTSKIFSTAAAILALLMAGSPSAVAEDEPELKNKIEKVEFAGLPGDRLAITITTTEPLQNPPA